MKIFEEIEISQTNYPFSVTLGSYNKMLVHFVNRYVDTLHTNERISNYGNNLYSQDSNNEFKSNSAHRKKIN